jgi:hypothetical protein
VGGVRANLLTASGPMDIDSLRDHANGMLDAIAADLETPQDEAEQKAKSHGNAPVVLLAPITAAEAHGAGRAQAGFLARQMVAEFRALRASIIRLWSKDQGPLTPEGVEDLTRFNEAIDQSLAESVSRFTADLDESKKTFLGTLREDLRTPISPDDDVEKVYRQLMRLVDQLDVAEKESPTPPVRLLKLHKPTD